VYAFPSQPAYLKQPQPQPPSAPLTPARAVACSYFSLNARAAFAAAAAFAAVDLQACNSEAVRSWTVNPRACVSPHQKTLPKTWPSILNRNEANPHNDDKVSKTMVHLMLEMHIINTNVSAIDHKLLELKTPMAARTLAPEADGDDAAQLHTQLWIRSACIRRVSMYPHRTSCACLCVDISRFRCCFMTMPLRYSNDGRQ